MKLPPFDYLRAASVTEATQALQDEEARVLAGGQSLLPLMAFRLARPERLVDVSRMEELRQISYDPAAGQLTIGAAVTHREIMLDRTVAQVAPFLPVVASYIGHGAIRARGTLGGSLAHADPAAEWSALAAATGAEVELRSHQSRRQVPAAEFCDGAYSTTIRPGEMLTAVVLDVGRLRSVGFAEMARRPGDFALAGAIWVIARAGEAGSEHAVTIFGLTSRPVRIPVPADGADVGLAAGREHLIASATGRVADISDVRDDVHASPGLRRHLAGQMIARAAAAALEPQGAGHAH